MRRKLVDIIRALKVGESTEIKKTEFATDCIRVAVTNERKKGLNVRASYTRLKPSITTVTRYEDELRDSN